MCNLSQAATTIGPGSVVVQVQGNGNSIISGFPYLHLSRQRGLARNVRTDPATGKANAIDVIRASTRSIKMVGREAETDALRAWLHGDSAISIRVLTGAAGCGKTRLALELIEEVAPKGWRAGFLTGAELKRFRNQHNLANWSWNAPVLAVVDSASSSARDLRPWLRELAENSVWSDDNAGASRPLRLLLLERQATRGRGWWAEAFGNGSDQAVLDQLTDPPEPLVLSPLHDVNHRRAILAETLAKLGSDVTLPTVGANEDFDRRLAELTWGGVPLLLMMAAVTAAVEGFGHVLALGSSKLAFSMAQTELGRIREVIEGQGLQSGLAPLVEHVVAIATLRQGLTADAACQVIEQESLELGYELPLGAASLRDALAMALPNHSGGVAPIDPDIVGEALLLTVWPHDDSRAIPAILRAYRADPDVVAETSIRTCQDYVIRGHRHLLAWLTAIVGVSDDSGLLIHLSDAMPESTLNLLDIAIKLDEAIIARIQDRAYDSQDPLMLGVLSGTLYNLSIRLADLCQWEYSLSRIDESVAIRRDLADRNPEIFLPDLANSLDCQSSTLAALGRFEESSAAIEEAVRIQRTLIAENPSAHSQDFASSLHNLATRFSDSGRIQDAILVLDEALTIRRTLVASYPDIVRPDLAASLSNQSQYLSEVNRHQEALVAADEAAGLLRDLVAKRSDAFLPLLPKALVNLSRRLADLGRHDDSLMAAEEAVTCVRDLVASHPGVFCADLAVSLLALSNSRAAVSQWEDSIVATEEAVVLLRSLVASRRDAFQLDLAKALNQLSVRLSTVGRADDALSANQEAVKILREQASKFPNRANPTLASALSNLSVRLGAIGCRTDALVVIEEAIVLRRKLAAELPEAYLPSLAQSLNNLFADLSALGQRSSAFSAIEEAVAIRRKLAESNPDTFLPALLESLNNWSTSLADHGRHSDALRASQEAVSICRKLISTNSNTFQPTLATSLLTLSNRLEEVGQADEALESCLEAVALFDELSDSRPEVFHPKLAAALHNLANRFAKLKNGKDGLAAIRRAVEIRHKLATEHPRAHSADLAISMNSLSVFLANHGRVDDALVNIEEALRLLTKPFMAQPAGYQRWMLTIVQNYFRFAKDAGRRTDSSLLAPILAELARLQSD